MGRRTTWILLAAFAVVVLAYAGWQRFVPAPVEATPTFRPDSPWSISPEQVESPDRSGRSGGRRRAARRGRRMAHAGSSDRCDRRRTDRGRLDRRLGAG